MDAHISIVEYHALLAAAEPERPTRRCAQPEYDAQVRFFVLLGWLAELHPDRAGEIEDVWSTSNGGKRPRGEAGRMRAAGQRKGVLDIECMVPIGCCHGLFIEMKSETGRPTPEQRNRIARLTARGYLAVLARSWQEAGHMLCSYLGIAWPLAAEANVELRMQQQRVVRKAKRKAQRQRSSGTRQNAAARDA